MRKDAGWLVVTRAVSGSEASVRWMALVAALEISEA